MKLAMRVVVALAVISAGAALAQPGPGASGPMGGMGPRWGQGVTPGWQMMTPEERAQHQQAMSGFKSYEECVAYRDQHHADMAARMKERGQTMPAPPRRDVCAGLAKKPT